MSCLAIIRSAPIVVLSAALLVVGPSDARAGTPVLLEDVLDSVERHYPLLAAALEERNLAAAKLLERRGAFDLRLGASSKLKPLGYYETYEGGAFLEQPTTLWGAELFGGYRNGTGDFAVWDGGDETNRGGEVSLGFKLPLFRDRAIDDRRAALRKAEIDTRVAEPLIRERAIEFARAASFAYWNWVATGKRVIIASQLLDVARQRQSQLVRRVERGALPSIDLADNERLIVDREVLLISAERDFQQAGIDLSLFLRDPDGNPRRPSAAELPETFPAESDPERTPLEEDIERAFRQQPLLQELALRREATEIDLALAKNRLLPSIDLSLAGSKDLGREVNDPDNKGPTVLGARIEFDFPVQRREARGQTVTASARLRQIDAELRFARDKVAAEVRNAQALLRASFRQLGATRRNVELARKLRDAEERKLLLGDSNLIDLNIRELQAFDAGTKLIAAQADFFRARANYDAATGDLADAIAHSAPRIR